MSIAQRFHMSEVSSVSTSVPVAELYRRYGPTIFARCRRLLKDASLAEDATQEVFMRVFKHIESAPQDEAVLAWIYRISTNYCLTLIRDRSRQATPTDELPETPIESNERSVADKEVVMKLLERMPQALQSVAILYHVDGLQQDQVANVLRISRRTVINRLQAFNERAQKYMKREGLQT